eukprot:scaffold188631_cov37-Attheya_sp.AAC.1
MKYSAHGWAQVATDGSRLLQTHKVRYGYCSSYCMVVDARMVTIITYGADCSVMFEATTTGKAPTTTLTL